MDHFIFILLASTIRGSLPLIFASLGGLFSERSGVVNIALEGMMLMGAFAAASVTLATHNPWYGLLASVGAGGLMAFIYALFVVRLKANQVVTGVAINMLASGLTPFLLKILYGSTASSPSIPLEDRLGYFPLILCAVIIGIVVYFYHKTPGGLAMQFAGEHPEALETSGVSVNALRMKCVVMSGILSGLGGATLSLHLSSLFSNQMTGGRGFMALAALILGKWKPIPTVLACLFFGVFDSLQMQIQGQSSLTKLIPVQFIQILPYVVTLVVLTGLVGKSRSPKQLGIPF
jgi:ABC-type uncharacterized transport system permease subunit